jgi:hypothetical protein
VMSWRYWPDEGSNVLPPPENRRPEWSIASMDSRSGREGRLYALPPRVRVMGSEAVGP